MKFDYRKISSSEALCSLGSAMVLRRYANFSSFKEDKLNQKKDYANISNDFAKGINKAYGK